jgi:hypothetical protein
VQDVTITDCSPIDLAHAHKLRPPVRTLAVSHVEQFRQRQRALPSCVDFDLVRASSAIRNTLNPPAG